ncbi:HAD-superfamily hydrolase, subfamily IIB [Dethiosulfovibrio peptidovorans DSM 11002]|uniref:HAD-superfamily hydrolase, subfamily IIB n=2 Tax=Dethiosulfovibrio TaxID=47054 RepID=D2Z2K9_9BACT|nr:HAD-superfamily hydrolase, subfamily IIB [Dethiosulfovibrio peptidovorans DSM 11002]
MIEGMDFSGPRRSAGPFRRLLVTDLDGTLLDGKGSMSSTTVLALERLRSDGWDISVASGRILGSALPHILAVGAELPSILYDGARIIDRRGQVYWEAQMDRDLVTEVLRLGWEQGVEVQAMGDELVFCRPQDLGTIEFFESVGVPYSPSLAGPEADLGRVFRVMFHDRSRSEGRGISEMLKSALGGRAEVVLAGNGFVDVLPFGVNKGSALKRLLDMVDVEYDIVVAVGDNENDMELLRRADVPVAISSAPGDLLALASWTVPCPEMGGADVLVDRLLKIEKEEYVNG